MLTYIEENEQLKQELDELRHKYDDLKDDYDRLMEINIVLADTLNELEKETVINQLGSVTNMQNKCRKILADGKSKLVPFSK